MADKSIGELDVVRLIDMTDDDSFVLDNSGTAKRLTGSVLITWLAQKLDGHGGINRIEGPSTSGLTDTYTIVFADDSPDYPSRTTFVVTNGKGISNIAKQSTSGLVDTYKITYNDNTSSTFTVTNGAKGDKGDKGDKGNKGDNITVSNIAYAYADGGTNGTNPTLIPSASWQSTIPTVSGGKFLWSRTIVTYSDSSTATTYVVAWQGLDGTGSVNTVNTKSPDSNHNVTVLGSDIAVSSSDTTKLDVAIGKREVLVVTIEGISGTENSTITVRYPNSGTNNNIEDDMVCIHSELSNLSAQGGDWTITTSTGYLTITGTFVGASATNATLYLMKQR